MLTRSSPQSIVPAHESNASDSSPPNADCLNCGAPMQGAFCVSCGQQAVDIDASTWHVVREALADATDFDGRVLRTARAILVPGHLTREFLQGRRISFVSPLKLFLLAGTVLTTTWIVTRGIDARFYGLTPYRTPATYIDTAVRGAMAGAIAIALGSWALAGARRRLLDEAVFALHLVSALALWTAAVIWLGTAWKLIWGKSTAVPQTLPALPFLLFLPASVLGFAYVVAAVRNVHRDRWWMVALRSAVIAALGVAAVFEAIVHGA